MQIDVNHNPAPVKIDFLGPLDSVHQDSFLIQTEDGRCLRVSRPIYLILRLMDGARTLSQISDESHKRYNLNVDETRLNEIIQHKLLPNRLIQDPSVVSHNQLQKRFKSFRERFVFVKLTLFPASSVTSLAHPLKWLFNPRLMVMLSLFALIAHGAFYFWNPPARIFAELSRPYQYGFIFFIIWLVISLLHEMGHAAACLYWGAKPGDIGVGLYIVFPVFWSGLKSAWQLKRHQRAFVDLGGLYMQWLINVLLIALSFLGNLHWLGVIIFWNNLSTLFSLFPFLRLDGYWLASDLIGVPNLNQESRAALINLIRLRKPSIHYRLHGINRIIFYALIVFTVLVMPLVFYRIWVLAAWLTANLPLKLHALRTILEQNLLISLPEVLDLILQVCIMLVMLFAWGVNFLVPLLQSITRILAQIRRTTQLQDYPQDSRNFIEAENTEQTPQERA